MQRPDFEKISALLEENREKFSAFRSLLLAYNEKFNLTAVTEERDVLYKHFADSLAGEAFFPKGASVAEVGSGAGFPSVPLMLVRDDLTFSLFESTGKKCEFLKTVIREFELRAQVFCLRAEEAAKHDHRERYDVCCARAVARLNTLAEYCLPFVRKGGLFLAYKGADDEHTCAEHAVSVLGGTWKEAVSYDLPEGYGRRTLVAVKKERPTPACYPRGRGAERKDPL